MSAVASPPGNRMAVIALLFGATTWGMLWLPYRLLERHGVGGVEASLLTYLLAIAFTLLVYRSAWSQVAAQPVWCLAIAVAAGWTNLAYVLAVLQGEVVRVLLLFYLAPLWTVPLAWAILGERLDGRGLAAVVCAMAGAAVTLWKPGSGLPLPHSAADWLGLSAGFGFALTNVTTRAAVTLELGAKVLAPSCGVVLLAVPWLLWHGDSLWPPVATGSVVALTVGTGVALGAIAMAVQYGVTHIRANRAIVIMLFEIVVGAVSSGVIAGERISAGEAVGALLIVGASFLAVRGSAD